MNEEIIQRIVWLQGWGYRSLNGEGWGGVRLEPRPGCSAVAPPLAQDTMILLISDHN